MLLEGGLGKLSGLKRLREISELGPETGVGVKEVQWMVANWPRLGVVREFLDAEARTWLKENTDIKMLERW